MKTITVVILAKNSAETIKDTLNSVKGFSEVLVCDTGSSDETMKIAKAFSNVRLIEKELNGFGKLRNEIASLASNEWILSLDSDEELSPQLQKEIELLEFEPNAVYSMPFHNFYNGKWIRGCGWHPDRHLRLYNRNKTCFSEALVHEKINLEGLRIKELRSPINHYSYRTASDFLTKMHRYSDLFAQQNAGKRSSLLKALLHGFWAFGKSYLLKRGFLDGKEGYVISAYNGQTAYYKYIKLAEINALNSPVSSSR